MTPDPTTLPVTLAHPREVQSDPRLPDRAPAAPHEPGGTTASEDNGHHRRPLRLAIYALITAATIAFAYLALHSVKFGQVWHALRYSDYVWLIPALAVFAAATMARALRWHALFAPDRRPALGAVTNAMLVGYLFNNIMPARAGEAARVVTLTQRAGTPAAEALGTVVVERVFDVLSILIVFFAAAPWLPQVSWFRAAELAAVVLAVGLGAVIGVLAVYGDRPLHYVMRPLGRLPGLSVEKVQRLGLELVDGLHGLRRPRVALAAFSWSLSAWVLSALSAWLVTFAFNLHLGFDAGVLVTVAVGAGMILPSPPAAVGVFEAAVLLAMQAYGLDQTKALPFALILHMVNFLPFLLAGVLALQYNAAIMRRRGRLAALGGAA
jgi:glycosyltransferase 2 family protein